MHSFRRWQIFHLRMHHRHISLRSTLPCGHSVMFFVQLVGKVFASVKSVHFHNVHLAYWTFRLAHIAKRQHRECPNEWDL